MPSFRKSCIPACLAAVLMLLAGCAAKAPPAPAPRAQAMQCPAVPAGDALSGTWLSVGREKGIAGELRTLFELRPDGTMAYAEQLLRGRQPPQGLSESGCWHREGQALVLRTTQSNGVAVDLHDPIYINRYTIVSESQAALALKGSDGLLRMRRMPPGYRLPF